MKNLLYASVFVISLFLTACTSMNSAPKITSSETSDTSSSNISDQQKIPSSCALEKNSIKVKHSTDEESDILSSGEVVSSKEISHALELCGEAQKAWEKGAADKAIEYLDAAYASILDIETDDKRVNKQKEDLRFMISKRIMELYTSRQTAVKGNHKEIPLTINKYVQNEIDRFTGAEKEFFIRSMARAAEYRPFITKELKDAGLPEELSWIPLIESGFRVEALSPARALGLWQFIPSTGYKFGLKRDYYVDERMDPFKSTQAAIKYLSELHKMFGDWSTVLAAYNCGEGRVLRTIRSQNINYLDNFWDLYEKLPQETARYVPRFIATLHIINNPEKYGIPNQKKIHPLEFQTVTVNKQLRLKDIARNISISHTVLEALNPELKYGVLPPEEYKLRIPANTMKIFLASLDDMTPSEPVPPKNYSAHRVRNGETLFSVAKSYGVTMSDLAAANNISIKHNISSGKTLKIPADSSSQYTASINGESKNRNIDSTKSSESKSSKSQNRDARNRSLSKNESENKINSSTGSKQEQIVNKKVVQSVKPVKYKVKQGDTMWSIAKRYNTTPGAIKSANSLSSYTVNKNKELIIPQSGLEIASNMKETATIKETKTIANNTIASNYTNSAKLKKSAHWVKSGDTPFTIAQKYNMSVQNLFDLNRLPKGSKIFPGQKLMVK
ncbi:MAG: LysM peptidoglycan-binding domain-containing protein [Desulfamplus sp.]|nr:LysM peptidoglycan-binding domain-containing protein [Desulfamplus sp.]